jgi:hypothetical protein
VNIVCALGVLSAIWAALVARRDDSPVAQFNGRTAFLVHVALLFNAISLALVVLESIPVYVVHPCAP